MAPSVDDPRTSTFASRSAGMRARGRRPQLLRQRSERNVGCLERHEVLRADDPGTPPEMLPRLTPEEAEVAPVGDALGLPPGDLGDFLYGPSPIVAPVLKMGLQVRPRERKATELTMDADPARGDFPRHDRPKQVKERRLVGREPEGDLREGHRLPGEVLGLVGNPMGDLFECLPVVDAIHQRVSLGQGRRQSARLLQEPVLGLGDAEDGSGAGLVEDGLTGGLEGSMNMAQIRGRDTKPEMALRSALHRMGLRFRVCRRDLPGKPDVVFPRQKLAIQVRGCFWHQHVGCPAGRLPASRLDYWRPKLEGNVRRDAEKDAALVAVG